MDRFHATANHYQDGKSILSYNWLYDNTLNITSVDREILANKYPFTEDSSSEKDLEKLGHSIESNLNDNLANHFVENFGLTEERAQSVAKITASFQKIQNKRSLTAKEMNIYSQKVFGITYVAGRKALEKHIQGDSSEMEALFERAAEINGTSPEAVQDLVGEFLLN